MAWKSNDHMLAGCAAAAKSPKTPAHLKPHLAARSGGKKAAAKTTPVKPIVGGIPMIPKKPLFAPKKKAARALAKSNPFYGE